MTFKTFGNIIYISYEASELSIHDANYFAKAFEPILVKGDDGKEYNVIPSDQFK